MNDGLILGKSSSSSSSFLPGRGLGGESIPWWPSTTSRRRRSLSSRPCSSGHLTPRRRRLAGEWCPGAGRRSRPSNLPRRPCPLRRSSQVHESRLAPTSTRIREAKLDWNTVGPWLSGHQLSGYLYYPAAVLQCIVYFPLKSYSKQKQTSYICVLYHLYPLYINNNLLQIQ